MKKVIIKIILILFILFIIDSLFGYLCKELTQNSIGGDTAKYKYISQDCNDEILIMGSSRCNHHYIPSIIEDSLNKTCYNCGIDGNGIITMYGLLNVISEYNTPDIIIYDITTSLDLDKNDNLKYLGRLKQYYDKEGIKPIFKKIDKVETYKMYSSMYQYNSKLLQLISDNLKPTQENDKGYKPLYGCMDYEPKENSNTTFEYDSVKLNFIKLFIEKCNNKSQLIFTTSPYYLPGNDSVYKPIREMCEKYKIPFLEHHKDTLFSNKKNYFKDSVHLNHEGAQIFTNIIIEEISKMLPNSNNK